MIHEFNNPIPVITPKGNALAIMVIDYGPEHNLHWVCVQDDTCECWSWRNPDIRFQKNITMGREYVSPFYNPCDVKLASLLTNGRHECVHPSNSTIICVESCTRNSLMVSIEGGGSYLVTHCPFCGFTIPFSK